MQSHKPIRFLLPTICGVLVVLALLWGIPTVSEIDRTFAQCGEFDDVTVGCNTPWIGPGVDEIFSDNSGPPGPNAPDYNENPVNTAPNSGDSGSGNPGDGSGGNNNTAPGGGDGTPRSGDMDGDGVYDYADRCPWRHGPVSEEGCPDSDFDGTRDDRDSCFLEVGPPENNGCPTIAPLSGDAGDSATNDRAVRDSGDAFVPIPFGEDQVCHVSTKGGSRVFIRRGPGTDEPGVNKRLNPNEFMEVIGISPDGEWYQTEFGWVFSDVVRTNLEGCAFGEVVLPPEEGEGGVQEAPPEADIEPVLTDAGCPELVDGAGELPSHAQTKVAGSDDACGTAEAVLAKVVFGFGSEAPPLPEELEDGVDPSVLEELGLSAVFQGTSDGNSQPKIYVLTSGGVEPLAENQAGGQYLPAPNPAGEQVAYILVDETGQASLMVKSLESDIALPILSDTDGLRLSLSQLAWAPDGSTLVVTLLDEAGTPSLYAIDTTSGADVFSPQLVLEDARGASYAPNGDYIAFDKVVNGQRTIHVLLPESGQVQPISSQPEGVDCHSPTFGMDSLTLFFTCDANGESTLYRYGVGGLEEVDVEVERANNPAAGPTLGLVGFDDASTIYLSMDDGTSASPLFNLDLIATNIRWITGGVTR